MSEGLFSKTFNRSFALKYNFLSNFLGTTFISLLAIVLTPVYISYIGVEAYGLIGFFTSLQALLSILDLGLGTTVSRELAVRNDDPSKTADSRTLLTTIEITFWAITAIVCIALLIGSPLLANWVNPQSLSTSTILNSFLILSISISLQFPLVFYSGAFLGMERHVLLSTINVVFGLMRTVGAVGVLRFISPTPETFFIWQAVVAGLHVLTFFLILRKLSPVSEAQRLFDIGKLRHVWKFAAGISGISILAILLTQIDKLVLSRLLPLETFGYYALAALVANGLGRITVPVFQAYFPRLTSLVGRSDETGLAQAYHQGCQLMAVAVLPLAAMFVFFSREILMLWQRNPETTENTWLPLSILMAGSALNAMLTVPYALQLAHAWTKLHFYGLLIAVVLLAPLTFAGAVYYGTIGAAAVWVLLNVSFILFEIPLIHKNILPNESSKWYLHDFGLPLFSVLITVGIARYGYVSSGNAFVSILQLGLISAAVFGAAILSSSLAREYVFKKLPGVR